MAEILEPQDLLQTGKKALGKCKAGTDVLYNYSSSSNFFFFLLRLTYPFEHVFERGGINMIITDD